jgi:predicted RNase H-like HicB family nuclease
MRTYKLYLESGPQQKTTLVHIIELLGCVANAKTTDVALAATPDAIRAYLTYLKRHADDVDPGEPFGTRVAEHITKGEFLGQGSPQAVYAPDLRPLTPKDLAQVLRWLKWSRADLIRLVAGSMIAS